MEARKSEFIALLTRTGWSQAEAARKLEMTRAGVNAIVTGAASPSPTLLKLLRLVVAEEMPGLRPAGSRGAAKQPLALRLDHLLIALDAQEESAARVRKAAERLLKATGQPAAGRRGAAGERFRARGRAKRKPAGSASAAKGVVRFLNQAFPGKK